MQPWADRGTGSGDWLGLSCDGLLTVSQLEWINKTAKGQQKKGQARVRRYEDLVAQAAQYVKDSKVDTITIPIGPRLGDEVLSFEGVSKAFGDRLLLDGASLQIAPGSVVGIVGGNGAGKTTLFRLVMGVDKPDSGEVRVGETVVPMYVEQSRESLADDGDKSVVEAIAEGEDLINLGGREVQVRGVRASSSGAGERDR